MIVNVLIIGILLGVITGAMGWAWYKLIQEGMIFSKIGQVIYDEFGDKWFYNAIGGCAVCTAGQAGLWIGGAVAWLWVDAYWLYVAEIHFINIIIALYVGGKGGS